jgi:CheY-like chemotaxis protein/nitrogen-specific signal transduction histidine kinase
MRALEEMAATLSLKVEERTAELRHANSQLQRAARSKDAFLASMSHELRTPLNAVLGLTEALMEDVYGPLNTGQRQALSTVDTSGKHLLALISDVLDLAKIHAGRLSLDKEPIPIRDLVHACVATVRRPAEKKGLHLAVTEIDPRLMVNTDGRRLKQILINLLANAVKFTPNGGRVMLDVRPRSDVQIIEFWVLDTGIGIPADRLEAIFEPFHQIDSKLSREYDGTGLGLALVSELVDAFGGSIAVESEVGRGSQFLVSLPWQETALRDAETVAEDWRPRRALVIEDVSSDAERLVRALDEFGIQTLRIDDTSEALAKIAEYRPDVLFLDIMLPEESGWEFLTRVRYQHNHLPVVVVSVLDDAEVSRAHGAVAHIVKPFAREDLVRALSRVSPPAGHGNTLPGVDSSLVGVKVLLAEDNEANVMAVGDYLRSHGIDLVVARNGQEAVDLALSERPAVILMDVQMPIMDGLQATRRIRAQERDSRVPIVALTALAMSADRERCLVAGADAYLSKPVRLADLLGTIAGFLRRSQ